MKQCPFCAEEIQDEAIKCKHCGEWFNHLSRADYVHKRDISFLEAVQTGNVKALENILSKDPSLVNSLCGPSIYEEKSPLHYACANGHKEAVEFLILKGADINALDFSTRSDYVGTPLNHACANGHKDVVEFLISKGADVVGLHDACENGHIEIVKFLISKGADVNAGPRTPLHCACENGHKDIAEFLISKGADVNVGREDLADTIMTPLHRACAKGHIDVVELLILKGADVNARGGSQGDTPLHLSYHNKKVAGILISYGADIDAKDNRDDTPLHRACRYDHKEEIKFLVANGADVNAKTNGIMPIQMANGHGHKDIVEFLRKHGAYGKIH